MNKALFSVFILIISIFTSVDVYADTSRAISYPKALYRDFGVINGCHYEAYWAYDPRESFRYNSRIRGAYLHETSFPFYHWKTFNEPWMNFEFNGIVMTYAKNDPNYSDYNIANPCLYDRPYEIDQWMERKKGELDLWAASQHILQGGSVANLVEAPRPSGEVASNGNADKIRMEQSEIIEAAQTDEYLTATGALEMGKSYPIVILGASSGTLCGTIAFLKDETQKRLDFIFKLWDINPETSQCFGHNKMYNYRIKNSCLEFTNLWGFTRSEVGPILPELSEENPRTGYRSISLGNNGLYGTVFKRCEGEEVSDELIEFHAKVTQVSIQEEVKLKVLKGRTNRTLRFDFSHGLNYHVILDSTK